MTRTIAAAAFVLLAVAASPALACQGSTVLFEDDFSFADPSWGTVEGMAIEDGKLKVQVNPAGGYTLLNQAGFYTDFDACIDVVQHNDEPDGGWGSLVFWGVDYDNFYTLDVTTSGYVKVSRLQNTRWLSPVDWTLTEGVVNSGTGVNRLRVLAKGNVATIFVNDQQIAQFRGQPPEGGGLIGVYGAAPNGSPASVDFANFMITSADADVSSAPSAGPAPALTPGTKQKN